MIVGEVCNLHLCPFIALSTLTYASVRLWPHCKATIDTAGGPAGKQEGANWPALA